MIMIKYSKKTYAAVAKADMSLLGVQLGAACIDAEIPVQVVARWMGVSRQGVYYWFTGVTDIEAGKRVKVENIIATLLSALDAEELPAKDLFTALVVVKKYRRTK